MAEDEGTVEETQENVVVEIPKIVIDQAFIEGRPLSYSSLKKFRKSPKHYCQYLTEPKKLSDAMILGSIIDVLVLTPELFDKKYMVIDEKPNLRTNIGKEAWQKLLTQAQANKQLMCTKEQLKTAKYCQESLLSNPDSSRLLLAKTRTQVKLEWRDKGTNLPCIGYVDFESKAWDEDFVVDLKSTNDADPDNFNRDIFNEDYQYFLQAGSYLVGYHKAKYRFPYFVNLAVETKSPYNVSVNFYDAKVAEMCKSEFQGTLQAFRYCLNNNLFHQGYEFRLAEGLSYFSVKAPGWFRPRYGNLE